MFNLILNYMTTIIFTFVPNELKEFFTKNKIYYIDFYSSFAVAVVTSDKGDDFYLNLETYKDCLTIETEEDDFDHVAQAFSNMFY